VSGSGAMRWALALGPEGTPGLHLLAGPGWLEARLEGAGRPVSFRLDGAAGGTGFEGTLADWSMARGLGLHGPRRDPVRLFARRLDARLRKAWGTGRQRVEDGHPFLEDRARARAQLAQGVDLLLAGLEPWALRQARRFAPSIRWAVYAALVGDDTRRVAQLSDAAPGALAFALHHARVADAQGREAAQAFREAEREGVPLKGALQPLLEDWLDFGARAGALPGPLPSLHLAERDEAEPTRFEPLPSPFTGARHPLNALAAEASPEQARRLAEQRWLLRHAPHAVTALFAWLPPPVCWKPDDLPRGAVGRRRWFAVLKRSAASTSWLPAMDPAVQAAAVRWLSRHAGAPRPAPDGGRELGVDADALMAWVHLHGLRLPLALSFETVAWRAEHAHLVREFYPENGERASELATQVLNRGNRALECADLAHEDPATLDVPLPDRLPATSGPGFSAEPLCTPRRIWEEGQAMRHCVAVRIDAARTRGAQLFHLVVEGAPLTVQLAPVRSGRWALVELSGEQNRRPTEAEQRRVQAWIRTLPPLSGQASGGVEPLPAA